MTGALTTPAQVVDAASSAAAGADPAEAELCFPDTLDPAKVAGKVVLCLRGTNDRIEKSQVVKAAGGVGMILYNPSDAQDTDTDTHWVPTVHVNKTDGLKVKQAIAAGTTTATHRGGPGHAGHAEGPRGVLVARPADRGAGPPEAGRHRAGREHRRRRALRTRPWPTSRTATCSSR